MNTLRVELGDRTYPIHIGSGMLARVELIRPLLVKGGRVAYITNTTVAPLYLKALQDMVGSANAIEIILPDGEQYKTLDSMNVIYGSMLEARLDRTSTVIALGGGVIGDMAGFAAATYQRGISFIQVPTTLLSQVDSSVGGKTGVNHPLGKNMIGAFYQPRAVIIDTDTLKTLPDRELSAGLAEVIKYGLIRDATFFSWLEANMERLLARDPGTLQTAIQRSCEIKADVVAADEKEGGVRAILNFGHTFGHAIETGMGYGSWLHGEAIAAGMVMAAQMSSRLGWINESDVERTTELIRRARLPIRPPPVLSRERFRELMSVDKKVLAGKLRLVLLRAMGEAVVTSEFPPTVLDEILGHPPTAR